MARRRRLRKVVAPPSFTGYKPYGTKNKSRKSVELLYEEYEALKLLDYDLMNQKEAAGLMGISRPTLARIYEDARRKIAKAFVEVCEIKTAYGNAWMEKHWYACKTCQAKFTIPDTIKERNCPICRSQEIESRRELEEAVSQSEIKS